MKNKPVYSRLFSLCSLTVLVLIGCSKSQNDGSISAANAGTWQLVSFQVAPAYNGTTDLLTYYDNLIVGGNCYSGLSYTFTNDGTINLNYPASGCAEGSDFSYFDNGDRWAVADSRLLINGVKTGRRTFDMQLTGNTMTLTYQSTSKISGTVTSTYTASFTK